MGEYRHLSGKQIIKVLKSMGFQQARQRGSHVIMKKDLPGGGAIGCVVPIHKEVAIGTLRALLKQAKITLEEFQQNL
jgi:predicted RNA binding protein YcfA (HicA-like mRNA interferase family)